MAIEKREFPYEFLVRFNPDGTVRGQHFKRLEQYVDTATGDVITEREGDAIPVGDAESAVPLQTALRDVGARLARAEEVERRRRERAEQARDDAEQAKQKAMAQTEAKRQRMIVALQNALAALTASDDEPDTHSRRST